MTPLRPILACLALLAPHSRGQDIAPKDSEREDLSLTEIVDDFEEDDDIPTVTVDLRDSAPSLVGDDFDTEPDSAEEEAEEPSEDPASPEPAPEPPPAPEPEGVTVQVEAGTDGTTKVDAKAVKLLAPFPAKPLFQAPAGWRLEHPAEVPTFVRPVDLANGTRISLAIRPHLLVPDADGENVIAVDEPGYDPALSYAQTGTMGAVLSSSVDAMEADSRRMSDALDRLSQLLGSLPAPEPPPAPAPSPAKKSR
jgi:hypothetical protein